MGKASRRKRDRRFERNHPKPFKQMSTAEIIDQRACKNKWRKEAAVHTQCAVCEMDVYLHCSDCQIQITGCLCVAVGKMSDDELRQFKELIRRKAAKEAGLILPPSMN